MNLIMNLIQYFLLVIGFILYRTAYCVLPSNYFVIFSQKYPYENQMTPEKLELANQIWNKLSYYEKADFVWHNTYIFIPNQPGNPYKIWMYKNKIV